MRRYTDKSYLLRVWRDRAEAPLRVTITSVATPHQRWHLANLDELQFFLLTQTGLREAQEVPQTPTGADTDCTADPAKPEH